MDTLITNQLLCILIADTVFSDDEGMTKKKNKKFLLELHSLHAIFM